MRVSLTGKASEDEFDLLCVYSDSGPTEGLYVDSGDAIGRLITERAPHMGGTAVKDTLRLLKQDAPVKRSFDGEVPVNRITLEHGQRGRNIAATATASRMDAGSFPYRY